MGAAEPHGRRPISIAFPNIMNLQVSIFIFAYAQVFHARPKQSIERRDPVGGLVSSFVRGRSDITSDGATEGLGRVHFRVPLAQ